MKLNQLNSFFLKYFIFFFAGLLAIGIFLRIFHLWDNIIFAFDQGRDATRILGIISLKHFKLVGPETDIPGVFNGPIFYYLIAPFYFLFNLNPNGPALEIAIINVLSALIVFYTGKILFNKYVGFLASLFWIFSYEQIAYSFYISNASFMGASAAIFFMGCALYFIRKKEIGLIYSAIGLGLCINFNFYLIYLLGFYGIFFFVFPRKVSIKTTIVSLFSLIVLVSPFFLSQLQFHFSSVKALIYYFSRQNPGSRGFLTVMSDLSAYQDRLTDAFFYSYFSFNRFFAFVLFLFAAIYPLFKLKANKSLYFLYIWLFSTLPLFAFHSGVLTAQIINSSLQAALAISVALSVWLLLKSRRVLFLGIICILTAIFSNLYLLSRTDFIPNKFFLKEPMTIREQRQVIDYTYTKAGGRPFSICATTNPLFINSVWGYLYNWHGQEKYGYLPFWAGLRQDLMPSLLKYDNSHVDLRFFIQEPLVGIPLVISKATIFMEDSASVVLDQKKFGGIIVQERILQKEPRKFIDSQNLNEHQIIGLKRFLHSTTLYSCYNTY